MALKRSPAFDFEFSTLPKRANQFFYFIFHIAVASNNGSTAPNAP
jgi:hypothetical protein